MTRDEIYYRLCSMYQQLMESDNARNVGNVEKQKKKVSYGCFQTFPVGF